MGDGRGYILRLGVKATCAKPLNPLTVASMARKWSYTSSMGKSSMGCPIVQFHCQARGEFVNSPHLKKYTLKVDKGYIGYFKCVYKCLSVRRFHSSKSKPKNPLTIPKTPLKSKIKEDLGVTF